MATDRINDRMDTMNELISQIRTQNARIETLLMTYVADIQKHEDRISVLERDAAKQRGIVIATSAIFGTTSGLLMTYLKTLLK